MYFSFSFCFSENPRRSREGLHTIFPKVSCSVILKCVSYFSHCLNTGFFLYESYPVLNFLEYPLIILQNFILIFVIGQVTQQVFKHVLIILAFIAFTSIIGLGVFPKYIVIAALVGILRLKVYISKTFCFSRV